MLTYIYFFPLPHYSANICPSHKIMLPPDRIRWPSNYFSLFLQHESCGRANHKQLIINLIIETDMDLRTAFGNIKPIPDSTFAKIMEIIEVRTVKKGECVIRQGQKENTFLLIKEGIFRLWFAANGKERTIGFGCAGDPFTSVRTYRTGQPSLYSFEALTDAEIYCLTQSDVRNLVNTDRNFADWMLAFLFEQLDALYMKNVIFGTYNATRRYEAFLLKRPEISRRVPAKYLAQYLNIAPETLSRIQSSLAKKKQ